MYTTAATEVDKELRSQIEKAKALGIDITHLDSHRGTLFERSDYLRVYIKLGHEYKIPVLLSSTAFIMAYHIEVDSLADKNDALLNLIYIAQPSDAAAGLENYYVNVLQ